MATIVGQLDLHLQMKNWFKAKRVQIKCQSVTHGSIGCSLLGDLSQASSLTIGKSPQSTIKSAVVRLWS